MSLVLEYKYSNILEIEEMGITLDDISQVKKTALFEKEQIKQACSSTSKQHAARPWESFAREKDLIEIITNRDDQVKRVRKSSRFNKSAKTETNPEDAALVERIRLKANELFGHLKKR